MLFILVDELFVFGYISTLVNVCILQVCHCSRPLDFYYMEEGNNSFLTCLCYTMMVASFIFLLPAAAVECDALYDINLLAGFS